MCFEVNDSSQTFVWWSVDEWMCHKGWWICNTQIIIINTSIHFPICCFHSDKYPKGDWQKPKITLSIEKVLHMLLNTNYTQFSLCLKKIICSKVSFHISDRLSREKLAVPWIASLAKRISNRVIQVRRRDMKKIDKKKERERQKISNPNEYDLEKERF